MHVHSNTHKLTHAKTKPYILTDAVEGPTHTQIATLQPEGGGQCMGLRAKLTGRPEAIEGSVKNSTAEFEMIEDLAAMVVNAWTRSRDTSSERRSVRKRRSSLPVME